MKITWFGHSAFALEFDGKKLLIDPFLTDNPSWDGDWEGPANGVTHVLLTHGHDDHLGDVVDICKKTGAMLVANFEICMYLAAKGLKEDQINSGNHGGTLDCGGFTTTFVNAVHSSSTQLGDGNNIYLGNPAGLIIHSPDEKTVYHMGDTDIFGDMEIINDLHRPEIGIVPIGDRFTMGGAVAALACRKYFDFDTILPCHYGSFPIIDQSADKFIDAMEGEAGRVKVLAPGESVER